MLLQYAPAQNIYTELYMKLRLEKSFYGKVISFSHKSRSREKANSLVHKRKVLQ